MTAKLLHISDLHITPDAEASSPLVNDWVARAWINSLVDTLESKPLHAFRPPYDMLVVTGDFVHKHDTRGFQIAKARIEELARAVKVRNDRIVTCSGNHDYDWTLERENKHSEARHHFESTVAAFAPPTVAAGFYKKFVFDNPSLTIISLDSTLGSANGYPGIVQDKELHEVLAHIHSIPDDHPLVILSHFPVKTYDEYAPGVDGEANWAEKHLWAKAIRLYDFIKFNKRDRNVVWLSGDVHKPLEGVDGCITQVVAGRFGTSFQTGNKAGEEAIAREANVILVGGPRIVTNEDRPSVVAAQNQSIVWSPTLLLKWKIGEKHLLSAPTPEPHIHEQPAQVTAQANAIAQTVTLSPDPVSPANAAIVQASTEQFAISPTPAPAKTFDPHHSEAVVSVVADATSMASDHIVACVSPGVEQELLEEIRAKKLFRLGRFRHSDAFDVLGRVSLGPLVSTSELKRDIVRGYLRWLTNTLGRDDLSGNPPVVFVGTDCWGTVFASLAGVRARAPVFSLSVRFRDNIDRDEHPERERLLKNANEIVMFADVVTTGQSIHAAYTRLVGRTNSEARWSLLSLLCDAKQQLAERTRLLQFVNGRHASACNSLRIPIIPRHSLPDESILPITVSRG